MGYDESKEPKESSGGLSGTSKVLVGCAMFGGLFLILICGGAIYGIRVASGKLDSFAGPFVEKGYQRHMGQVIDIRQPVDKPTVYTGQVVRISANVDADLAVMAQVLEIDATVKGDIDFLGQVLIVKKGGVVEGDIRVQAAQSVDVRAGKVTGKISGSIQSLRPAEARQATTPPPEAPAPPLEAPAPPTEAPPTQP